ncbi:helix-turn-helix domain-containing protein [Leptothoe sp. LEGE 181152]|nr:helix-turn-helix domain-containing protein [Leptothoe sp. LEGE 181152]
MAPSRKLDDEQLAELRQRYIGGETQAALAKEYGVSEPTVRRYTKGLARDYSHMLQQTAYIALIEARKQPFRSAGEAANTGIAALKALRALYPQTMREAARWVVTLPGFQPEKFAQLLIEEWGGTQNS